MSLSSHILCARYTLTSYPRPLSSSHSFTFSASIFLTLSQSVPIPKKPISLSFLLSLNSKPCLHRPYNSLVYTLSTLPSNLFNADRPLVFEPDCAAARSARMSGCCVNSRSLTWYLIFMPDVTRSVLYTDVGTNEKLGSGIGGVAKRFGRADRRESAKRRMSGRS